MRKKNGRKKFLSILLSLCLLLCEFGTLPAAVYAEGETQTAGETQTVGETPKGVTVYVDGVSGADTNDGLTDQAPLKTMKAAYGKVPADNEVSTIVVIGEVKLAENDLDLHGSATSRYVFPVHSGEVIITSKVGENDYTATGALNFGTDLSYCFQGNTTFEQIEVSSAAKAIHACYYELKFGEGIFGAEGVTYYPAKQVYLGLKSISSAYPAQSQVKDAVFSMESGKIEYLYGGSNWYKVTAAANYNVYMTINGGSVDVIYGSSLATAGGGESGHKGIVITVNGGTVKSLYGSHGSGAIGADGIKITVKKGATVKNIYGADKDGKATVTGTKTLNLVGYGNNDWEFSAVSGFTALGLTNSALTITEANSSLWTGITRLEMTDDSSLKFEVAPTTAVDVIATKSGESWNADSPLITAPAATGENIFTLSSPISHVFSYASDETSASWTLAKATELPMGQFTGEEGAALDIDLKLPDSYTALPEDATAYETYLAKLQDLTAAGSGQEVPTVSPVEIKGEVAIYVDPVNGADTNKGSFDAPLKTIQKALSNVEMLQTSDEPFKGIVVYLRGGTYFTTETISLGSVHSGKNQIPVIISAYEDEEVVISGGSNIAGSSFGAVKDISEEAYNKLPVSVRDEVVAVSLKDLGISTENMAISGSGANYQLFVNGEELTLARYPNATKLALTGKVEHIGEITLTYSELGSKGTNADDPDIRFEMTDLRPTLWDNTDGTIWLNGSLYAEWEISNIRVKEADAATGIMRLDGGTGLGARTSAENTYYYYNILEELDVPGEFYLNTTDGILYLYPISDMSTATVVLSAMQDNLIEMTQTESVVLNGLTIENGANFGIYMTGCKETLIQNCTLRNLGYGVRIHGQESGMIYSDVYQIANAPARIGESGGLTFDYTPEQNFLQNCYIHSVGTKNPKICQVRVYGTGNVVSHNLLQGMYGVAIYLQTAKECIVEYNEIVGAPTGVYDYGAIYHTYDALSTGSHIRYNYIHDIGTFSDKNNPHGIYFDEGLRGNYAYGNIMSNLPSGFFTNSGSENVIINNIVTDGREGTTGAIRGSDNFASYTIEDFFTRNGTLKSAYEKFLALSADQKSEVKERYPLMVKLYEAIEAAGATGSAGLFASRDNYAHDNLIYDHGGVSFTDKSDVGGNTTAAGNPFTDVQAHDFSLTDSGIITWAVPSTERMGILAEKQAISAFSMYAPSNENQKVDPFQVLLKWSNAGGADSYVVKISKNADMSDAKTYEVTTRNCYLANDDYFTYDTLYYWTVTANTTAKSRSVTSCEANDGAVFSFRTMTREEYLASNPIDASKLEATVAEAESFLAQVRDVSDGGLYADGTYDALAQSIAAAKAVLNDLESQDQVSVNQANALLANAILTAKVSKKIQYVTFDPLSADDWTDYYKSTAKIQIVDGELQISNDTSTEAIYDLGLGLREILCFQFKQEAFGSWWGFALAQSNTGAYITDAVNTNGYMICFSGNEIQLQKRNGGKDFGNLAVVTNDGLFEAGKWYDLQMGAINNADGSVRIYFKINDTVVFDYTDSDTAISNVENFGIVIKSGNGIYSIKPSELEEEIEITVDNIGAENSSTVVTAPENGWSAGTNTFTVSSEQACMVLVSRDGGQTYTRLEAAAVENAENSYSFTAEDVTAETIIAVALAGDVNGDGKVSTVDSINVRAAVLGQSTLSGIAALVADVNGDGKVSTVDSINVKAAVLGTADLEW